MAKFLLVLFLFILHLSMNAMSSTAQVKVIYGIDDRIEPFEASEQYQTLAKATAGMVPKSKIQVENAYEVLLGGTTLEGRGMCASEAFSQQPTVANCSGFLVAEDILVTAGHCMRSQTDCEKYSWVFDYKVDHSSQSEVIVDKEKVFECAEIIERELSSSTKSDYAVIKLKKKVTDRKPVKFRTSGEPSVGDELVVIGHPTGLPTKIADGAFVRSVGEVFLVASLDTYGGNSGSAVFNAQTGVVEGILVRGDTDYVWDSRQRCRVSNVLSQDGGRGEDVSLITKIESLKSIDQSQSTDGLEVEQPEEGDSSEPRRPWWWRWIWGF
jgi:V8-like Glu-specific endopeptidase